MIGWTAPNLTQTEDVNQPAISTEDLSVVSFDAGHKPSGSKVADDDDSLATAQASIANMVNSNTTPPQPLLQSKAPQSWLPSMSMLMTLHQ